MLKAAIPLVALLIAYQWPAVVIKLVVVVLVIAVGLSLLMVWKYISRPMKDLPGPSLPRPLWLSLFTVQFAWIKKALPCHPHLAWVKEFGPIVEYTGFFQRPRLVIADQTMLRDVLVTRASLFQKPVFETTELRRILGDSGLLVTEGKHHARLRRILNKHFEFASLKGLVPIFVDKAKHLAAKWSSGMAKSASNELNVELRDDMTTLTLDIIGLSGFGLEMHAMDGTENELHEAYRVLLPGITWFRIFRSFFPFLRHLPFESNKKEAESMSVVNRRVGELIADRRRASVTGPTPDAMRSLLDIMMHAGDTPEDRLTEQELVDNCLTFLIAGHETTSNALSWTFYLLAQHPEVERKLREDVQRVLREEPLSYEAVCKMPYLQAVCKESLRLYPPVPMTIREPVEDVTLTATDGRKVLVPKGQSMYLLPFIMQRLPEHWGPDVDEFKPERFLAGGSAEVGGGKATMTWLPFLAGPRACIGQRFALIEMQVVLAELVSQFSLRLQPGATVEPKASITMRPHPGLPMIVRRADDPPCA